MGTVIKGNERKCIEPECGKTFIPPVNVPWKKYCSKECRVKYTKGPGKRKRIKEIPRGCRYSLCGKEFLVSKGDRHFRKFCSDECRNLYFKDIIKERTRKRAEREKQKKEASIRAAIEKGKDKAGKGVSDKTKSTEVLIIKKWINDPIAWVCDTFGDNIRKECKKLTGVDITTKTGLTVQQEKALYELGKIIRAKLAVHFSREKKSELSDSVRVYASKIGLSIQSGQGSGKDFWTAVVMCYFMQVFEDARIVATANTAKQLRNVLWSEISKVMSLANKVEPNNPNSPTVLQYLFELQSEKMFLKEKKGERWFAEAVTVNVKASEKEQGEALAGRHERYMLIIADEACGVPDAVFRPLEGTLTGTINLLILIFNPTKSTGFAIESQNDSRFIALRWNCEESEIVTKSHINNMEAKYGRDSNTYRIRVLGLSPLIDEYTLFPVDWVMAAIDREIIPLETNPVIKALDCGAGGDKSVLITRKGGKVYSIKRLTTPNSQDLINWAYAEYCEENADIMRVDNIGIGWAVYGALFDKIGGNVEAADSRCSADNPERFINKRAEMFWRLREQFEKGCISLPNDIDLINQLIAMGVLYDNGKIKIIEKKQIKKTLGHSPDECDALAMTYYYDDILFTKRVFDNKYCFQPKVYNGNNDSGQLKDNWLGS